MAGRGRGDCRAEECRGGGGEVDRSDVLLIPPKNSVCLECGSWGTIGLGVTKY